MRAKSILILGHTEASLQVHPAGIGEITHAAKLHTLIGERAEIVDIYSLFGEQYESLALLNHDLADRGHPILQEAALREVQAISASLLHRQPEVLMILSRSWSVGATMATGVQRKIPTVSKFYLFHENERVIAPLYEPSDLLVTESLLANQRGIEGGIPPWKMIYLPHHYPAEIEDIQPDPSYLERLATKCGKPLKKTRDTVVIGMVSRLELRKNCGYLFNAVAKLVAKGADLLLVYKGSLDGPLPDLSLLEEQPWFLWDRDLTPFPEVLTQYATFDLFCHLSGYEGASNVVVEMLALGIPTLVLNASTNPSLFKGGVLFVNHDGTMRPGQMPYRVPDEEDLLEKLALLVEDRHSRAEWAKAGKAVAMKRFHPRLTRERIPLILNSVKESHFGRDAFKQRVEALYLEDLRR